MNVCNMCGGPLTTKKTDVENPDRWFQFCTECGRATLTDKEGVRTCESCGGVVFHTSSAFDKMFHYCVKCGTRIIEAVSP